MPGYCSYPYFNSPSEFGDAMVDAGFNMISLASNHSADCTYASDTCITNSYNYWKSKNVIFDGFNEDESKENKYNIGEKNGIKYVGEDFMLATAADIVADPSAPDAFVQGIMEGKEWVWDGGILKEMNAAKAKQNIERLSRQRKLTEQAKLKTFKNHLLNL